MNRRIHGLRALPLGLALLALAPGAPAAELLTTFPVLTGMSGKRLQRIDWRMNQAVADGVMVGGVGMVARKGRVVYTGVWGLSDRESGEPMAEDTIFRIYSMTKPVTSVALMMLYEEGHFLLDDPVAKYLPELAGLEVAVATADSGPETAPDSFLPAASGAGEPESPAPETPVATRMPRRQPTVRDLMIHTAGFTYGLFGDTVVDRLYREAGMFEQDSVEEFVADLGRLPLQYEPGSRWHYSVSVDVQGRLIEALSGMRLGEFLQARLFEPLGMEDTGFVVPEEKWPRLAQLYSPEDGEISLERRWVRGESRTLVVADSEISESYREGLRFEGGGGGLVSTAMDYLRFAQMLLNGGEFDRRRYLSPKTVALIKANHLGELPMGWNRWGWGFGLGFGVRLATAAAGEVGSAGEYGWGGAAGTSFWIDPRERLIGVFMVQSIPHRTQLREQFKALTYQAITRLDHSRPRSSSPAP